jgi:hypothetical protein
MRSAFIAAVPFMMGCSWVSSLDGGGVAGLSKKPVTTGGAAHLNAGLGYVGADATDTIGVDASLHGRITAESSGLGAGAGFFYLRSPASIALLPRVGAQVYYEADGPESTGVGPYGSFAIGLLAGETKEETTNAAGLREVHRDRYFLTFSTDAFVDFRTDRNDPIVFLGIGVGALWARERTILSSIPKE